MSQADEATGVQRSLPLVLFSPLYLPFRLLTVVCGGVKGGGVPLGVISLVVVGVRVPVGVVMGVFHGRV